MHSRKLIIFLLAVLACGISTSAQNQGTVNTFDGTRLGWYGQPNTTTAGQQYTAIVPIAFSGAPTGTCTSQQLAINTTNGVLYNCASGSWVQGGGAITFAGTPTGTCTATQIAVNTTNGLIYSCVSSAWTAAGGLVTVSSLPATCTAGTTAPVNLVISGSAYGVFNCGTTIGGTNVWIPDNPSQTVSPLAYGARADVKFVYDATFSSGSGNVSCGQTDCGFTSADVGKIVQGYKLQNSTGGASQSVALAQTTIQSVTDASHIVTVGTAAASCVPSGAQLCSLAWGTQADDAAMALAETAAWSTPGVCRAIQLPTGNMFFNNATQPLLWVSNANLSSACGGTPTFSGIDTSQSGPEVFGNGPGNSLFIPLDTFTFANCTAGASGTTCVGGTNNLEAHDFGINGLGQGLATTTHANFLFGLEGSPSGGGCTGSTGFNLTFSQWGGQATSSVGVNLGQGSCGDPYYANIISEGFGAINCEYQPQNVVMTVVAAACFGNSNGALKIAETSGGILNTFGGYYGGLQVANTAVVNVAGMAGTAVWNSSGDNIHPQQPLNGESAILANGSGSGTINLTGDFLDLNSGTTSTSQIIFLSGATINVHVKNSTLLATGANNKIINLASGSTLSDDCGNRFTAGTIADVLSGTVVNCPSEPSYAGRCLLASQASPEPCVAASNGKVAIPASQATYTINTVAVQSGSTITITPTTDNTGISGAPTCTLPTNTAIPSISASVAGTSFTIAETSTASITCFDWSIR